MKKLFALYKKFQEIIDYLFWGVAAFVLSMILFWVFVNKLGWIEWIANIIDWIIVVIFAFFTNKFFVFRSKSSSLIDFCKEFISFTVARLATLGLEEVIIIVGCNIFGFNSQSYHLSFIDDGTIVKLFAQVLVIITNYVLSKLIVFRKPKNK
ncbi:MAG: GtrA family protein [Lachnospiraceae bacterium]|nr:GtrA family protein [Candidatus Colinaster equi]